MIRALVLALSVVLGLAACKKEASDKNTSPPPGVANATVKGTVAADGIRHIPVEANGDGYTPNRIAGKPGEKLVLVFTRTIDADCIAQLKTPDGKLVDLPKGQPVDVAVTVPTTGEVGFACGMDMFHGIVVADPKS
jgi:plastocyanin domain-containing protein